MYVYAYSIIFTSYQKIFIRCHKHIHMNKKKHIRVKSRQFVNLPS